MRKRLRIGLLWCELLCCCAYGVGGVEGVKRPRPDETVTSLESPDKRTNTGSKSPGKTSNPGFDIDEKKRRDVNRVLEEVNIEAIVQSDSLNATVVAYHNAVIKPQNDGERFDDERHHMYTRELVTCLLKKISQDLARESCTDPNFVKLIDKAIVFAFIRPGGNGYILNEYIIPHFEEALGCKCGVFCRDSDVCKAMVKRIKYIISKLSDELADEGARYCCYNLKRKLEAFLVKFD